MIPPAVIERCRRAETSQLGEHRPDGYTPLAELVVGDVGRMVRDPGLVALTFDERLDLDRVGCIPGTRIRVVAVGAAGELTIKASRGTLVVNALVANAVSVIRGELALLDL